MKWMKWEICPQGNNVENQVSSEVYNRIIDATVKPRDFSPSVGSIVRAIEMELLNQVLKEVSPRGDGS